MDNTSIWDIIASISTFGAFIISVIALIQSNKAIKAVKKLDISRITGSKIEHTDTSKSASDTSMNDIENSQIYIKNE